MFFTDEQMKFINQTLPDIQNKEYADYSDDELDSIQEMAEDKLLLECFDKHNEPLPKMKEQMDMCYSIIDKLGDEE